MEPSRLFLNYRAFLAKRVYTRAVEPLPASNIIVRLRRYWMPTSHCLLKHLVGK